MPIAGLEVVGMSVRVLVTVMREVRMVAIVCAWEVCPMNKQRGSLEESWVIDSRNVVVVVVGCLAHMDTGEACSVVLFHKWNSRVCRCLRATTLLLFLKQNNEYKLQVSKTVGNTWHAAALCVNVVQMLQRRRIMG